MLDSFSWRHSPTWLFSTRRLWIERRFKSWACNQLHSLFAAKGLRHCDNEVSVGANFFNPSASTSVFAKLDVTFGKAYGSSIELTGASNAALWGFLFFYLSCAALTWLVYSGPRGILRRLERSSRGASGTIAHASEGSPR